MRAKFMLARLALFALLGAVSVFALAADEAPPKPVDPLTQRAVMTGDITIDNPDAAAREAKQFLEDLNV